MYFLLQEVDSQKLYYLYLLLNIYEENSNILLIIFLLLIEEKLHVLQLKIMPIKEIGLDFIPFQNTYYYYFNPHW